MNPSLLSRVIRLIVIAFAAQMLSVNALAEWKEKVLYSFQGGNDGSTPAGGVVFDKAGNLYGVTNAGGSTCASPGCGVIFQLSPEAGGKWKETILYGFNGTQGSVPVGGAIIDGQGNLYGTTAYGGSGQCKLFGYVVGCGVVYELSPPGEKGGQWTYAVLYNFQGGKDGLFPWGDLTLDTAGNLYGATRFGGGKGTSCDQYFGGNCGTVFKLIRPKLKGGAWTENILHSFAGGKDGAYPSGGLVLDNTGAIYGTTYSGGNPSGKCGALGCGTVFELSPRMGGSWSERLIHIFQDGSDGAQPMAGLVSNKDGALFGTSGAGANSGVGVVYQLTKAGGRWTETVLFEFTRDGGSGAVPMASLTFDLLGNLYSTTNGGTNSSPRGNVFRLKAAQTAKAWTLSVLHTFAGPPDGMFPAAQVVFDEKGNLYSTTTEGGTGSACNGGCGAVFEASP